MSDKSSTVRISSSSKKALREVARITGVSQIDALGEALEEYRRKVTIEAINESFARLDNKDRADYEKELEAWDTSLQDGLEEYPYE
ncbi:MAG: toxin-antitoxin system protein [Candidatus Geothermincolia bacterium]